MSDTHEPETHDIPAATPNAATTSDTPGTPAPSTPAETPVDPDDIAPSLIALIASVRAAIMRGASAEVRAVGAAACRSLLAVLEAKPGQPLTGAPQPLGTPASPLASLFAQPGFLSKLAAMSRDELLGLLKQVTTSMPARAPSPTTAGPRFHIIELPTWGRRPGGGS